ncbi:hypothetical protein BDP27DRAFT_1365449 [Rhodocollybia butyracea]|uniref:DUF6533 domain-containing protein n=1 Tax=Rhodocollybia butyracea TaxID=206335 RepID=A0A9P5PRJ5_9AGAR|nr:hypothetical protein BDP27DRAFT_1365449 [Rhodocollybia butyracea]
MDDTFEIESIRLANTLFASSLIVLFYDHLLTLDSEIRLLWRRPKNASGYLFFVNRYLALGNIVTAVALFPNSFTPSVPDYLRSFYQAEGFVLQLSIFRAIFALRIYALYGCKRVVLIAFTIITILGTVISSWLSLPKDPSTPSNLGCQIILSPSDASTTAIGWEGLMVVDAILFLLTMRKAYQWGDHFSLSSYGMTYMVLDSTGLAQVMMTRIMTLLNLSNIISLHVFSVRLLSQPLQGNLSAFVGCLSVTLTSRMILNLHEAADTGLYTDHTTTVIRY